MQKGTQTDWPRYIAAAKTYANRKGLSREADDFAQFACMQVVEYGTRTMARAYGDYMRATRGDTRNVKHKDRPVQCPWQEHYDHTICSGEIDPRHELDEQLIGRWREPAIWRKDAWRFTMAVVGLAPEDRTQARQRLVDTIATIATYRYLAVMADLMRRLK